MRFLLLCFVLAACSGSKGDAPASYTVNAKVERLEAADTPTGLVYLAHEDIPDFHDEDGKKVGMKAMTMPFRYAEGVEVSALKPGDEVKITFRTDWSMKPATMLTAIQKTAARRRNIKATAGE